MHKGYVGKNVISVMKVKNNGSYEATGVILTNILPPNTICSYMNFTQGTYTLFKNKIVFIFLLINYTYSTKTC